MNRKLKIWIFVVWALIIISLIILFFLAVVSVEVKKPAIYLYPEEDSFVDVSLKINGKMTESIPCYDNGWNVFVTKEGLIDNQYDYLFYEADLRKMDLPEGGWVVGYGNLEEWFRINLIRMGLNEKEMSQFVEYWMENLPESNYYLIKLLDEDFLEENMALNILPKPDIMIRLEFYFQPLYQKIDIIEPVIETPERNGFVVVEWGGLLDD